LRLFLPAQVLVKEARYLIVVFAEFWHVYVSEDVLRVRLPRAQATNGKPPPVLADGGKCTWMKNGERCQARWLFKDHAFEAKLKARHHSRSFF
jgi:hypothetical protein